MTKEELANIKVGDVVWNYPTAYANESDPVESVVTRIDAHGIEVNNVSFGPKYFSAEIACLCLFISARDVIILIINNLELLAWQGRTTHDGANVRRRALIRKYQLENDLAVA